MQWKSLVMSLGFVLFAQQASAMQPAAGADVKCVRFVRGKTDIEQQKKLQRGDYIAGYQAFIQPDANGTVIGYNVKRYTYSTGYFTADDLVKAVSKEAADVLATLPESGSICMKGAEVPSDRLFLAYSVELQQDK